MPIDPYSSGVLKKEHHERLVADLQGYALDAGIQSHWIYTPVPPSISEEEFGYLRDFKKLQAGGEVAGLCYIGKPWATTVGNRMSLVTGVLVRNFVRARLLTLGSVIDHIHAGDMPDVRCLLIPNFFLSSDGAGTVASWQVSSLLDLLMSRRIHGQQTVLYVQDMQRLKSEYGASFVELIENHYVKVRA